MEEGVRSPITPVLLGDTRPLLDEMAGEDGQNKSEFLRRLVRKEYKRRRDAEARIFKPAEEAAA